MNSWAEEGGNPFANAKWDAAWKLSLLTRPSGTRFGTASALKNRWLRVLQAPRDVAEVELSGNLEG